MARSRWGFCGQKMCFGNKIRQAFRPRACEILTDVLQILVPRLFVPLNLRVTLVTLYQGPPTPGDSIPAASSRRPRGVLAADVVWRDPRWATFGASLGLIWPHLRPNGPHWASFGPLVAAVGPHLGRMSAPWASIWAPFMPHWAHLKPSKVQFGSQSSLLIMSWHAIMSRHVVMS